jgi:hypothetical protein
MDPNVWRHLPTDLVRWVLSLADLPIDTRLYFKLENKKLNLKNFFKNFRNNLVYDNATQTLWDFRSMSDTDLQFFLKRKNFKFSCFRSPDMYVFNMGWDPYDFTLHAGSHTFGSHTLTNHLVIRDKIKFIN